MKLWICPVRTDEDTVCIFTSEPKLMNWLMIKAEKPVTMPAGHKVKMDDWGIYLPRPFVQEMVVPALIPDWPKDDCPSVLCVELEGKPISIMPIAKFVEPPAPPAGQLF